jgi:hypothetical protein
MQSSENSGVNPHDSSWTQLADVQTLENTRAAVERRGIHAELVDTRAEALERLTGMIPSGAEVMAGASRTLDEIGFTEKLKLGQHGWKNLKAEIFSEKDAQKQAELRRLAVFSEYFVGSVQAVTEDGEVVATSASGSQLAAYAFGAKNIVWVAGTQKVVRGLDEAIKRVKERAFPLENERMKALGYPGSMIGKILLYERASPMQKANLIFVKESLGF